MPTTNTRCSWRTLWWPTSGCHACCPSLQDHVAVPAPSAVSFNAEPWQKRQGSLLKACTAVACCDSCADPGAQLTTAATGSALAAAGLRVRTPCVRRSPVQVHHTTVSASCRGCHSSWPRHTTDNFRTPAMQAVLVNQVAALYQKTCRDTQPLHAKLLTHARLRMHARYCCIPVQPELCHSLDEYGCSHCSAVRCSAALAGLLAFSESLAYQTEATASSFALWKASFVLAGAPPGRPCSTLQRLQ
jgi:hypothetical protein